MTSPDISAAETDAGHGVVLPSEEHVVRDLDLASKMVFLDRCLVRAPLTPAVSSAAGAARLGVLVALVDVGGSDPALAACRPDWTATQDLSIHATGWLTDGPVVVDSRLVRVGSRTVVVAADVYDGHGIEDFDVLQATIDEPTAALPGTRLTLAARSLLTFARLPGTAASGVGVDDHDPSGWVGQVRRHTSGQTVEGDLYERMGLRVVDAAAGVLELDRTPYVANSIGTINGGAQAMLLEAAAEAMRPDLVATDAQIHFLSQVKVGPARTIGAVSRDAADHSVVTVELVDAGNADKLLALATVTLQRPPA
jgi:acyl-coenzyme A thioesterase PaaI-like protein